MVPDVCHWKRNVLCERACPIDPNSLCVFAEVPATSQAIAATATYNVPLAGNDFAGEEICYIRTYFDDLANEFVTNNHGNWNCFLSPSVPVVNMQIRAANSSFFNAD